MTGLLDGKVILITGSGRGIGRAIAHLAASEGAAVVVNDYGVNVDGSQPSEGPAEDVAREIREAGGRAVANFGSVADAADAKAMVAQAVKEFGRLDGLVNNAGIDRARMIFNMTEDEWDLVLAVHLRGNFLCSRFAAEQMAKQRSGCILGVTSGNGTFGTTGMTNYGSAKAAIIGLSLAVAQELAPYGVRSNAYHIGAQTRMTAQGSEEERAAREAARKAAGVTRPMGGANRPGRPEDGAPLPVYLMSDMASAITGRVFYMGTDSLGLYNDLYPTRVITREDGWSVDDVADYFKTGLGSGVAPFPSGPQPSNNS
ncbi:MAG: SDR family NAD(P)-dependent oxidoreductase [Dehalococcoidia bacterium]